jgi:hypothetical protein
MQPCMVAGSAADCLLSSDCVHAPMPRVRISTQSSLSRNLPGFHEEKKLPWMQFCFFRAPPPSPPLPPTGSENGRGGILGHFSEDWSLENRSKSVFQRNRTVKKSTGKELLKLSWTGLIWEEQKVTRLYSEKSANRYSVNYQMWQSAYQYGNYSL